MALPQYNLTIEIQNPGIDKPLIVPLDMACNTEDAVLYQNVEKNSRLDRKWVRLVPEHDLIAVLVGGGPSLQDTLDEIRALEAQGAVVFALNGAAKYLHLHGILPDYQVILDPRPETAELVGPAVEHLFASQCDPSCFEKAPDAQVWHLEIGKIEEQFPEERPGSYVLIGGAASVGVTTTCLAYAMGFREMHCFGYDSSRKPAQSHAYRQAMNDGEPLCRTTFGGKEYECSLTMKMQAERFMGVAYALERAGCEIHVHGSGLLPDMYNVPHRTMTEVEKYEHLWAYRDYREFSPGEQVVEKFLAVASPPPGSSVLDFGCGTGRAGLKLAEAGYRVTLTDFTENSRDLEARALPFFQHDLTHPVPRFADYGFCTDVMEHIPPEDVDAVIANIMASAPVAFFQINTVEDNFGILIGQRLHLTIAEHAWWKESFQLLGYSVIWDENRGAESLFLVTNEG